MEIFWALCKSEVGDGRSAEGESKGQKSHTESQGHGGRIGAAGEEQCDERPRIAPIMAAGQ
jgi:hypothetical protein